MRLHDTFVRLFEIALKDADLTQAEFCRRAAVSPKHVNQVLAGKAQASITQWDYWAFVLDKRWDVSLLQRATTQPTTDEPKETE